jgi:hypothetical protein
MLDRIAGERAGHRWPGLLVIPPRGWAHFGHTLPSLTKNPEAFQLRDSL